MSKSVNVRRSGSDGLRLAVGSSRELHLLNRLDGGLLIDRLSVGSNYARI